jgi:tetratricopeptide (TPR) repeat protein
MEAATMKALALDDTLPEVHHGLAALKWVYYRDWAGAEQAFRRAIKLNSRIAAIHSHYSIYLAVVGRSADAIAEGEIALELDPLSIRIHRNQAMVLYHARRYDEAARQYSEALELDPDDAGVQEELANVCRRMGADQRTSDERAKLRKRLAQLNERSKRGEYVPAALFARACMQLDEKAEAFRWLEKARDERNALSLLIATDPIFDSVSTESRFAAVIAGMNLGSDYVR